MTRPVTFLYLQQEEVKACGGLDMPAYVECVESGFRLHDQGLVNEPISPLIHSGGIETKRFLMHPGVVGGPDPIAGIKWIPSNPENPTKLGLPRSHAITILNDPESGYPLCVMDGTLISHMRTGAVCGVGVKYLARPGAAVVGLIGAGPINRTQLWAITRTLPGLSRIQIYDLRRENAQRFVDDMGRRLGLAPGMFTVVDSAESAARGADVVACATIVGLHQQYLRPDWLEPGALAVTTSVNDPTWDLVQAADLVVVDTRDQLQYTEGYVLPEAVHRGLISPDRIHEIGAMITGRHPGRTGDDQRILFSPIGMAVHDLTNARRVFDNARRLGRGIELKLWDAPEFL